MSTILVNNGTHPIRGPHTPQKEVLIPPGCPSNPVCSYVWLTHSQQLSCVGNLQLPLRDDVG